MYAIYKQTHPPTAVEHCAYCHFFSSQECNLVIGGATQLRVYRFILQEEAVAASVASDKTTQDGPTRKKKFELLGQYSLFGNIQSLKAVQLSGNPRESLLLSFDDAKLAIIEYDPGTHDIKTRSLHYFEDDEMKGINHQHYSHPIVRVDPDRRCAVMLIYGRHLVVLPFRQEGVLEDQDLDAGFAGSGERSAVLPSYTINLREAHEKLVNIIDIQFLHGYYEPTLVFLSEPLKTWPGRLAMRSDTCALIALSLNMVEHVHPVIWSLTQLPFDCNNILAVPKPIGGVLVCATNSLLYLNQSVPPYGVSLNSIADQSTAFPLRPQEGLAVTLDGSQAIFISNEKLVFALKGGEIYVVTLVADGVRSVRSFNFDKAAASVMTSCICECGDGYLFLGSRLGNSLLVKYTEKPQDISTDLVVATDPLFSPEAEPPQAKKRRIDSDYTYALDDLDELEVYGKEEQSGVLLTSYTFEVCDSLLNIGPCTNVDVGEPAFLSEEFADNQDIDLEVVTCSGYGKNGALSVLQRSIRPQVVTTFELPGCTDMWTLLAEDKEREGDGDTNVQRHHSFLLLSREDSSMVLKTEQEIMELDHSGFSTQYPTVFAGNLGNGKYVLQVTPLGVRLLEGINQIQHIPMDAGLSSIVWCSVSDPYAVMMTADGSVILLEFTKDNAGPKLTVSRPDISQNSKVCACCAYRDVSGSFTTEKAASTGSDKTTTQTPQMPAPKPVTVDDEDELLYGDSSLPFTPTVMEFSKPETPKESSHPTEVQEEKITPTYWCVLCRENGVLEIYSIPDFTLVFCVRNFSMAPRVLVDTKAASTSSTTTISSSAQDESLFVKEVLLTGLGYKNRRPMLIAVVEQDLLVYEGFQFMESSLEGHLNLRFRKLQHNLLLRDKKSKQQKGIAEDSKHCDKPRVASLRVFSDISAYSGVFVCGPYPHWLFMTNRGALRTHPMNIDGAVTCFAAFHNVNCPKGFLYFNKKGELRISVLPTHLSYDAPWPVRKVPLRCTAHHVAYNRESKTHVVVTSQHEPCRQLPKVTAEEREFDEVKKGRVALNEDDRFVYPNMDKFYLQLISPVSWEVIPNTRLELEEWEHVTTMKNVMLRSEETHSGMKGFICVGTTHVYGEEITCRGRILIFDIIEVVPEPGQPLTKNKFKMLYDKEQKGPVSALTQVNGYLVSAIGQKIYIWNFKDNNDLVGMAFIDTQMYIHSMRTLKNIILAADVNKSITALRLQEETNTLAFVSRDARPLEVYAAEFVIDGAQLGFLVSDVEENLVLFTYQPEALESFGGQRLLQRADINVGSQITTFFRLRAKSAGRPGSEKGKDLRQLTYFGTLDGAVGLILPVTEKTYRRLHMLQTKLVECIPHYAGLNPKAFRLLKWKRRPLANPHRNVLDWELLSKFVHLGTMERLEVTKKIGTTPAQILDDLMELERACAHF